MRSQRLPQLCVWVSLLGLSAFGNGCGGSKSQTAPTPQPTVLNYSNTVPSGSHWYRDFQTPRAGRLTLTLRWTDGSKDLDLYLTLQGCNYWEERCASSLVGRSELASGIQEQLSLTVQSGTTYTFWVLNYGAATEEARVEVRIE